MSADSLACKVCRALIDCPKQEADDYVAAIGEHLFKNSSAISALDLCYPCLQNARSRPTQTFTASAPTFDYNYRTTFA